MEGSRLTLGLCAAMLLAACSQQEPASVAEAAVAQPQPERHEAGIDADAAAGPESGAEPAVPAADEPEATGDAGFDIESVPVSDRPLGEFPYFSQPEGYHHPNRPIPVADFDRVAVWTGDRLEWVEGRVHRALVNADRRSGKAFSRLEVERNIEHQVAEAGGVKVTQSRVPREAYQAWLAGEAGNATGRGAISNHPVSTYLVRRADRDIWIHFAANTASGGWRIVESAPFEATAALLPSSELRQALDREGRVAVQVHFATDQAQILAESQPQIDQILELLREDPDLALSVNGHTDDTGGADHNRRLSEARARSVVAALTDAGIDAARLAAAGFGQTEPVADNDTEEGRARNRRVELVRR